MRERIVTRELMDDPAQNADELHRSLADLRDVNRWLGGNRTVLKRLGPILRSLARQGPIRLLDVGTGSADLPILLVRWARRRGIALHVTATDLHPQTLRAARAATESFPEVQVLQADALQLPFASGSFHITMCCTALHHFVNDDAVQVLRELRRVASDAVLVSDLRRTRLAMAGARALAATLWRRHPVTRHDGPASVAAALTVAELKDLADRAGMGSARVRSEPIFRISLLDTSSRRT